MYIYIIIIIIFLLYHHQNIPKKKKFKCNIKKINHIIWDYFTDNKLLYTGNINWDIYLPYNYTFIDLELDDLEINGYNKFIGAVTDCDILCGKDNLCNIIVNKIGRSKMIELMPNTYLINSVDDMKLFINEYQENRKYILKNNKQKKKGLFITNNLNDIIENLYRYKVIQEYNETQILINKRRISLRIYILIQIYNNNKKVYLYKNGKCLYSQEISNKKKINEYIANIEINHKVYNNLPLNLYDLKKIIGTKNFDNLYKNITNICIIIFTIILPLLGNDLKFKNQICYQLFGADFIFTKNFRPYLLEINKDPELKYINYQDLLMKEKLIKDIFDKINFIKYTSEIENDFYQII